jgi:nicotinamide mononucleotide transporter
MDWHHWLQLFAQQIKETTALQWIAVALGVAEVLLARVNNVWLYPAGIVGTALSIALLFEVALYAECLLNLYYIVMSVYGWYYWVKKQDKPPVKISWCTRREWMVTIAIVAGGTLILYFALKHYTTSNVPFWDAWVSATAWAGMWQLARRKIENWVLLNLSNIFAIPLLFYKKLPMFGMLTVVLFVVGVWGFIDWVRIYKQEKYKPVFA